MIAGNILTLEDEPKFTEDHIPKVPKAKYMLAKGGEKTFELDPSCSFGDGKPLLIIEREAKEGEKLRDVNFKWRMDNSENIAYRMKVRYQAEQSMAHRQLQMELCRSSIIYFINTFCWTFIPGEEAVPFILYDFQEDLVTWMLWLIKYEITGLVEKSRCQGLSWLARTVHAYVILFYRNKIDYSLSLGKAEVDDKTTDSLFGKQRYLFKHLPAWMRGGWDEQNEAVNKLMYLEINQNNSLLKGLLTGSTAGRSGRGTFADYDEFAHVQSAPETLQAASSLSRCSIFISTVRGMDNEFARMSHRPDVNKKSIHWKVNPTLNDMWAIKERASLIYTTQETWDQEMEIQYETSTPGRVFYKLVSFVNNPDEWCHLVSGPNFEYDSNYTVSIGMDFGLSDPNTVVFAQVKPCDPRFPTKHGHMLVFVDEHSQRDEPLIDIPDKNEKGLCTKIKEKGYRYETIVGDLYTADKRENATKMKYKDMIRQQGLFLEGKRNDIKPTLMTLNGLLEIPGMIAINKDKCPGLVTALQNWSYPTDQQGLPIPNSPPQVRSQHSHFCKAILYLCDFLYGSKIKKSKKKKSFTWNTRLFKKVRM